MSTRRVFTPQQITAAFFTTYASPEPMAEPQGMLQRAFGRLISQSPRDTDADSLIAACGSLRDKGFSDQQVAIFKGVVSSNVREYLDLVALQRLGEGHDSHSLKFNFSENYFLGVRLDGQRLDAMAGASVVLEKAIQIRLQMLTEATPALCRPEETVTSRRIYDTVQKISPFL